MEGNIGEELEYNLQRLIKVNNSQKELIKKQNADLSSSKEKIIIQQENYKQLRAELDLVKKKFEESEFKLLETERVALIGYWDRNFDTGEVNISEGAHRIFGIKDELTNWFENWMDIIHPDDKDRMTNISKSLFEMLQHGDLYEVEYRIVWPDGQVRDVLSHVEVIRGKGGQPQRMFGTIQDITERNIAKQTILDKNQELQKTMQHLEQSQNMLQLIIESIPIRVFWKDIQSRFLGCNTLLAHDAGLNSPAQLIGKDDYEMVWKEQAAQYRIDDQQVTESRCPKMNIVEPQTTNTGKNIWLNTSKVPLLKPNGEVFGILGIYEDITERKQAEEDLKHTSASLKKAQHLAHIGSWELDLTSNSLTWSDEIYRMFEIDPNRFGENYEAFLETIHPDDRESVNRAYKYSLQTKTPYKIDHRLLFSDGRIKYVHEQCETYFDGNKPVRSIGIVQDITEQRLSEIKIQESEQLFRALVENSPDFIARYDLDYHRTYVNPAIQRLFEKPEKELIGKSPMGTTPLHMPQIYVDNIQKVIETAHESTEEIPFRTAQGEIHWGHIRFVPEFDQSGQVASVLAIGRDINEIKENEQRFRMLAENFPDFVVRINSDLRYVYVNPAVENAFNIPYESFIGERVAELSFPGSSDQNKKILALIHQAFLEGKPNNAEVIWNTFQGARLFELSHIPEKDATGNVVSVLSIAHDITERQQAEEKVLQSEQRLRLHREQSPLGFLEWDENFCATEWNAACERIFGYTREEAIGQHAIDLILPVEVTGMVGDIFQNLMNQVGGQHSINQNVTKDGRIIICEWFNTTLVNRDGKAIGVASVCNDITERKQTEQKLSLLNFALNKVSDEAYLMNENYHFAYVNEQTCKVLGYTQEEMLKMSIFDIDPEFSIEDPYIQEFRKNGTVIFDAIHKTRTGRIYPVEIRADFFTYDNTKYILAIARDITEFKKVQEERENNLYFFQSLDRINKVIQQSTDLEMMMRNTMEEVLSIFDCDRASLFYPCDPDAKTWSIPMEVAKPEYPGVFALNTEIPMVSDVAQVFSILLTTNAPVIFGQGTKSPQTAFESKHCNCKHSMSIAIHPKIGKPWQFCIQQCSQARAFKPTEELLLQEIARRLEDSFTSFISYHNLKESEERFFTSFKMNPLAMTLVRCSDKKYVNVNDVFIKESGFSYNEIINHSQLELGLFASLEEYEKMTGILEETGYLDDFEFISKTKYGETRIQLCKTSIITLSGERHFLSVLNDITEKKQIENELIQSDFRKTILNKIAFIFLTFSDEDMYNEILSVVLKMTESTFGLFGYLDEKGDLVIPSLTNEIWDECLVQDKANIFPRSSWGTSLWGKAIQEKKIFISEGPFNLPKGHVSLDNFMTVPIIFRDETIGLLSLANKAGGFTIQDRNLFEDIANFISPILNARLQRDRQEKIRKQTQEALRNSEERFSKIFKLSPIASAIFNKNSKRFVDVNDSFTKSTGFSREEIIGHLPSELNLFADDRELEKNLQILEEKGWVDSFEFKTRNKDGVIGIGLNTTIEIELAGEPHFLSLILDITKRKHAENELRKLSQAVEQSPVSIVITDTNGNVEYVNSKFMEITGFRQTDILGQNPRILKSGEMPEEGYAKMWQTITSGKEWFGEFHNKKKSGELYWELASISPIFNKEGVITNYLAIKEDITKRKQAEEELTQAKEKAEESDRLKSAFLANVSHEIRTPMNGILGFAGLLKEAELNGETQQEYIDIIEKSGMRMLNIINDIVCISKIEAGIVEVDLEYSNINEQIDFVYNFFKPEVEAKGIQLSYKKSLSSNEAVTYTDKEKLYAILTNLVKNAVKFTDRGSIEFGYSKKKNYLEFYVKDTGIGIPKESKEAIFKRFIQADIADKMARQGAGLGLSISKAYVELLGGQIWEESEEGEGAIFYFTIPYQKMNKEITGDEKVGISKIPKLKPKPEYPKLKILVVEDDNTSSLLLSKIVGELNNEMIYAKTGNEAINLCRSNTDIDLVLMDIQLPDKNGYEATKQIRQFNKEVIIVAQTAFGLAGDKERAIEAGCNDYISKPIDSEYLLSLILKYFEEK